MADDVKAAPKVDKAEVEQEVSYIGARLSEKSTYAGLSILIALALPHFAGASDLVTAITDVGMGIGILVSISLPEKGSPVGKINSLGMGVLMLAIAAAALST